MPVIKGVVQADGAIVNCEVGWGASQAQQLRAALQPVPVPVTGRGLIDTGAEMTCVDSRLVRRLRLPFAGPTLVNLPAHGGLGLGPISSASLTVIHPSGNPRYNLTIHTLPVIELSLAGLGYDLLIGRNALAKCGFVYDGRRNRFRLEY